MKQAKRVPGIRRRDFLKMSLATGGAAALGLGICAPAIGQSVKTLRFGHMLPDSQIHHKAIVMFARGDRQALGQQDQGRDLPELAARHISEMLQSVQAGSLSM